MPTRKQSDDHDTARLDDLEIKLAFAEELLETLNRTVAGQAKKIDALSREVLQLKRRMESSDQAAGASGAGSTDESPPHY